MNITYTINNDYVKYMCVSMLSLLETNSMHRLTINVISYDLSSGNKESISDLVSAYNQEIRFYQVDDIDQFSQFVSGEYSKEVYLRLFMPWKLTELDKTLFLDADTIINGDISELFDIDMNNLSMLGVLDCPKSCETLFARNDIFGREDDYRYYNAGVMMWNLSFVRENYQMSDFYETINIFGSKLLFNDQDIINYLFYRSIKKIDSRFNLLVDVEKDNPDFETMIEGAAIIHFAGCNPWKIGKRDTEDFIKWWEYAKKSPYYNEIVENTLTNVAKYREIEEKIYKTAYLYSEFKLSGEKLINKKIFDGKNKIALYGAGAWGRLLLSELGTDVSIVSCIIDKKYHRQLNGITVYDLSKLELVNSDDMLIITSPKYYDEIYENIKERVKIPIYCISDIFV